MDGDSKHGRTAWTYLLSYNESRRSAMPSATKSLHLPLPVRLHEELQSEALRRKQPATVLAREAIQGWLQEQRKRAVFDAIRAYADAEGGGPNDLDPGLEAAGIDVILGRRRRR